MAPPRKRPERRGQGDNRDSGRDRRDRRERRDEGKQPPKTWGGVARRGSRNVKDPPPGSAARAWREAVDRARGDRPDDAEPWAPEVWVEEPDAPVPAPAVRPRKPTPPKAKRSRGWLPADVRAEVASSARGRADHLQRRLAEAARDYERDRYRDALKVLRPLADAAPDAAAVRELLGLTFYRLGRWSAAVKEFEAFHSLTGSYDQHPTLADCYRGLKRYRRVSEVWEELRVASPSAELVAEGRLVLAGSLADRGDLRTAIATLEAAPGIERRARAQDHHLRLWYALADLYERAGELPRARELFRRVADRDRDLYDVGERLANLS
jgi:tetratricopeptide (TPR) repeat protein